MEGEPELSSASEGTGSANEEIVWFLSLAGAVGLAGSGCELLLNFSESEVIEQPDGVPTDVTTDTTVDCGPLPDAHSVTPDVVSDVKKETAADVTTDSPPDGPADRTTPTDSPADAVAETKMRLISPTGATTPAPRLRGGPDDRGRWRAVSEREHLVQEVARTMTQERQQKQERNQDERSDLERGRLMLLDRMKLRRIHDGQD